MSDDSQLLRRYVENRSETAFAELVERHLALVYHSALRQLGDEAHQAHDVTQAVFLLLAGKARTLLRHPSLAGWLHATTHYKAMEVLRAERRRRRREEAVYAMNETVMDSPTSDDWQRVRPVLDEAALALNERDREAILLRFFEGLSFAEIGLRLALTEKTAHKRVERALNRLRDPLARRGITSSAAALATMLSAQGGLAAPGGLAAFVTNAVMAGPGPAAAFTLLQLVSGTKAMVAAALVMVAATGGMARYEFDGSRAAAGAVAAMESENHLLWARLRAAPPSFAPAAAPGQPRPTETTAPNRPQIPVRTGRLPRDGTEFLKAHPEVREVLVENFRATNLANYRELLDALALNPAQIRQFQDIEMNMTRRLLGEYIFDIGAEASSGREHRDQLRALLGEAGLQQYDDYNRDASLRMLVTQLASAVYFTAEPLTPTQADGLKQVIRDSPAETVTGLPGLPGLPWNSILAHAPAILSHVQLAALQDIYSQALYRQAQSNALRVISLEH